MLYFRSLWSDLHIKCEAEVGPRLNKLLDVWSDIGITGDYLSRRQDVVVCHLTNIVDEMIKEEEAYKKRLIENVEKAEQEIDQLSRELSMSLSDILPEQVCQIVTIN